MEDLFARPTTRFRDLYRAARERGDCPHVHEEEMNNLVELELITGSSSEDTFLHRGFSWSEFYSFGLGKMVWLSPDVFFNMAGVLTYFQTEYRSFLSVSIAPNGSDEESDACLRVHARSEAHATVASDILLQLLTTCESRNVVLGKTGDCRFPVSGLAFSHFLAQSRNLRVLAMTGFGCFTGFGSGLGLNTCHCRAIDTLTRTDLQIELSLCELTESGEEILLECIRQNRGPTALIECRIDTRRLAGALRGNNSVTYLAPHRDCSDEERLVLVLALAENEGLVTLDLSMVSITDEFWIALWRSVAHHPTLESIHLPPDYSRWGTWRNGNTDAQKTLRMQAMVDALRVNTVLHTIEHLRRVDFDEKILNSTAIPLLLANRYRPHVGAITKEKGPWRRKLLGRALGSVSSNPSWIWMFLSGNADVRLGPAPRKRKRAPNSDEKQGLPMN
jgi:hypothetical protein